MNDHISKYCYVEKHPQKYTSETDSEELLNDHISKYCYTEKHSSEENKKPIPKK